MAHYDADTPAEAGKITLSRYAGLVTDLIADVGGISQRVDLLERSDRMFKILAVGLLGVLVVSTVWCGVEFHTLNATLLHLGPR